MVVMSKSRSFDLFRVTEEAAKAVIEGVPPGVARQTVEPEPKHCGKGWLCAYCRPCSCACAGCKRMPMTDTRGLTVTEE